MTVQRARTVPLPSERARPGPTLQTLHMIERSLRSRDRPISLNGLKGILPRKVQHSTLRYAIDHYKRLGCVVEGSKGVMWVLMSDPRFWAVVDTWPEA